MGGNQLETAVELFEELRQQAVAPNVITYSALISACEKCNQLDRALEIFKTMQQ